MGPDKDKERGIRLIGIAGSEGHRAGVALAQALALSSISSGQGLGPTIDPDPFATVHELVITDMHRDLDFTLCKTISNEGTRKPPTAKQRKLKKRKRRLNKRRK